MKLCFYFYCIEVDTTHEKWQKQKKVGESFKFLFFIEKM